MSWECLARVLQLRVILGDWFCVMQQRGFRYGNKLLASFCQRACCSFEESKRDSRLSPSFSFPLDDDGMGWCWQGDRWEDCSWNTNENPRTMRAVGVFFVLATTCTISYIYDMSRFPYVLFETWVILLIHTVLCKEVEGKGSFEDIRKRNVPSTDFLSYLPVTDVIVNTPVNGDS